MNGTSRLPWLVPAIYSGGAVPALSLAARAWGDGLGANPIERALHQLGLAGLVLLIATLACTPLQLVFKWTWPARIRRALGLLAFGYVTAHFAVYLALDLGFAFRTLGEDLAKRPFITVGFAAWLLLVPLALTSTDAMVRRLGYGRWKRLHRLAYLCAALGVVHFVWRVKKDATVPLSWGAVLGLLLVLRVVNARGRKRAYPAND